MIDEAPSTVASIEEYVKSDEEVFDFNEIVPIPAAEADNWYDWNTSNWGTKWNACESSSYDGGFSFQTAWGPSTPVTIELSKKFPRVKFTHVYCESGSGFAGKCEVIDGDMIVEEYVESSDNEEWYKFLFANDLDDPDNYLEFNGKFFADWDFDKFGEYWVANSWGLKNDTVVEFSDIIIIESFDSGEKCEVLSFNENVVTILNSKNKKVKVEL